MTSSFVWHDLFTSDIEASKTFYGGLFGYTFTDNESSVTFANADGEQGSLVPIDETLDLPPHWQGCITVKDFVRAAYHVGSEGGKLLSSGKGFVVFTDPEGAPLKAVQGSTDASVDSSSVGAIVWDELLCHNVAQQCEFFQLMTGWDILQQELWPAGTSVLFTSGETTMAGVREVNPRKVQNSLWLSYFRVDDVAASLQKVTELGGSVVTDVLALPNVGLYAVVTDSLGSVFAILQSE